MTRRLVKLAPSQRFRAERALLLRAARSAAAQAAPRAPENSVAVLRGG